MNSTLRKSAYSVGPLAILLTILLMQGFAPKQVMSSSSLSKMDDGLILVLDLDQRLLDTTRNRAQKLNNNELREMLLEIHGRMRDVEQWAGFMHAYERQLRKSDPKAYERWDTLTEGSVSLLFITANSTSMSIQRDLEAPDLPRDFLIAQYSENAALVELLDAYRVRVGKAMLTSLWEVDSKDVLLEAWE